MDGNNNAYFNECHYWYRNRNLTSYSCDFHHNFQDKNLKTSTKSEKNNKDELYVFLEGQSIAECAVFSRPFSIILD